MSVSYWQTTIPPQQLEADLVIIGAGLVGCSAAIYAAQLGKDVILIDAGEVGLGASSRNAGFMLTGLDLYYHHAEEKYGAAVTKEVWQLSQRTHAFWREVAEAQGVDILNCGSLLLAESVAEKQDLEQAARRMDSVGFPVDYHSTDPLGRGFHAAIKQPQDGALNPYHLVRALYRESGARVITNSAVYNIVTHSTQHADGKFHLDYHTVRSRRALVRAPAVLICVNGWAGRVHHFLQDKVMPVRAQCFSTHPLDAPLMDGMIGYSNYGYHYFRDLPDSGFLLGGGREHYTAAENNTTEDHTTSEVQTALDDFLMHHFREIRLTDVERRWAGIMGFTADGLPLVGTIPNQEQLGFAVGLNGHGLSLGAAVAERAVDMLINGASPGVFGLDRATLPG